MRVRLDSCGWEWHMRERCESVFVCAIAGSAHAESVVRATEAHSQEDTRYHERDIHVQLHCERCKADEGVQCLACQEHAAKIKDEGA